MKNDRQSKVSTRWKIFIGICTVLLLAMQACAGTQSQQGAARHELAGTLLLSKEWSQVSTAAFYMMTRSSAKTEYMLVQKRPVAKPFLFSKKSMDSNMPPAQACDVFMAELSVDPNLNELQVGAHSPVAINGYDGFKLEFAYGLKEEDRYETTCYGFIIGDQFYSIRYNVLALHKDKISAGDLEKIVMTFRPADAVATSSAQ